MAEATGLRNNALPYPVYGAPFGFVLPITDADGDMVTSAAGLDSEVSKNGDALADCTNEATEIGGGLYYLLLTGTELTADAIAGVTKTSTADAKTTSWSLYPRKLVTVRSGTAAGGDTGYITLDAGASAVDDYYNGLVCIATIDSNIEARIITDYTGSSKQAAVTPAWNIAPDNDDTFVLKLPEGVVMPTVDVTLWKGATAPAMTGDAYARLGAPAGASVSADVAAVKTQTAAIEADTQDLQTQIGTDGAGLTAIGDTRLANLDATVSSRHAAGAAVAKSPATLAAADVSGNLPVDVQTIKTQTVTAAAPVTVPASIGTSTHSAADVKTALEADGGKLDHLWEMTEDDGGVRRLTANALEQAPGTDAASVAAAILVTPANKLATDASGRVEVASATDKNTLDSVITAIQGADGDTLKDISDEIALVGGGAGAGTGTYTDTVTDGTNPLDGVRVQLSTDSAKANPVYQAYTNALGVFLMHPDPGAYYVWFEKAGYDFSAVNGTGVTVT